MMATALLLWLVLAWKSAAFALPAAVHQLDINIHPADHSLHGRDRVTITSPGFRNLKFRLSRRIAIDLVQVNQEPREASIDDGWLTVPLEAGESQQTVVVEIGYSGKFEDPVPVNPVNTDNPGYGVVASISEQGCLLLSGAGWYPELEKAEATYHFRIRAPKGWLAVTAGRLKGHRTDSKYSVSEWVSDEPLEGFSLSVAPFKVTTKTSGRLKAATYLLSDDPKLAHAYLDATLRYLELYTDLFGPYAFDQFAVVENFFPTGYGFPGYTLLGSRVLRLPFIIRTSLGHEIAHCWWGNGVTVDYSEGNWSEGMTTYLADYLFKERQSASNALAYRRQMLRNYSSLTTVDSEFALAKFSGRTSPLTKAIGYDKSAMVFHMLRRQLGENAFWGALNDVYRQRLFRKTAWSDLQAAFEHRAGRSLAYFFDQWILQKGAPRFRLLDLEVKRPVPTGPRIISGSIEQDGDAYIFPVTLRVHTDSGYQDHSIQVQESRTNFKVTAAETPRRIELDPGVDLLRRLARAEIPPTVNSLKGGDRVAVLVSGEHPNIDAAAETLIVSLGFSRVDSLSMDKLNRDLLPPVDILVVGPPPLKGKLGDLISPNIKPPNSIHLDNKHYDQPGDAFFGVFTHPEVADRVIGFFWSTGNEGAVAARKITHYGKYSYLVFRNGRNIARGTWPIENSPIEHRW